MVVVGGVARFRRGSRLTADGADVLVVDRHREGHLLQVGRRPLPYGVSCSGYRCCATEGGTMSGSETGQGTGTKDKDYKIIWFTEACLSNALRLETYIQDADREGDRELAEFFGKAQAESRKGAEQGKELCASGWAAD